MQTTEHLSDTFLYQCSEIGSREEYETFIERLRAETSEHPSPAALDTLKDSDLHMCAASFLQLAVQEDAAPSDEDFLRALGSRENILVSAASLCFVQQRPHDPDLQRKVLLGATPFEPSPITEDARYYLIQFMGFSADERFADVLHEAIDHSHFCYPLKVAKALEQMGYPLDPEEIPYHRSITVTKSSDGEILIHDDDRFSGSSNCRHCKFFPCVVSHYFPRAIEDCKLWNKENPKDLGEIRDFREWGAHLKKIVRGESSATSSFDWEADEDFLRAAEFMDEGYHDGAIPLLCSLILRSDRQVLPVAWVRLAECLTACGEQKLAFLVMREVFKNRKIFPQSYASEFAKLQRFSNDPSRAFDEDFDDDKKMSRGTSAIRYAEKNFHTVTFDIRVDEALCSAEGSAGNWFVIGECHRALDEVHLAELFLRRAALQADRPGDEDRYTKKADAVHGLVQYQEDPGISRDRRALERRLTNPTLVLGDAGLKTHPAEDARTESAYWLVVCEEASIDELAVRILMRIRGKREGLLLDIPAECHSNMFYLLNRQAESVFKDVRGFVDAASLKKMGVQEIVEGGLMQRDLGHQAAALFAILHDELYHEARFSQDVMRAKTSALASIRFLTAHYLYLSNTLFADNVSLLLDLAQGAVDLLITFSKDGETPDQENEEICSSIRDWIAEVQRKEAL